MSKLFVRLAAAIENDRPDEVQAIIDQEKSVLKEPVYGQHLVYQCVNDKSIRCLEILLRAGADPNGSTKYEVPLHASVRRVNIRSMELILELGIGVDVEKKNQKGQTPLEAALEARFLYGCKLLIGAGANVDTRNSQSETALHLAVMSKHFKVVKFLWFCGAKVNASDCIGRTPLHYAVIEQSFEILEFLVKRGGDVCSYDSSASTPLHHACVRANMTEDDLKTIRLLLEKGAPTDATNSKDLTPIAVMLRKQNRMSHTDDNAIEALKLLLWFSIVAGEKTKIHILGDVKLRPILWRTVVESIALGVELKYLRDEVYDDDLNTIYKNSTYSKYYNECVEELRKAQVVARLEHGESFVDLLVGDERDLERLANNEILMKTFEKTDFEMEFPIYGPTMVKNVNKARQCSDILVTLDDF